MNKMAMGLAGDTRSSDLVNACYAAVSVAYPGAAWTTPTRSIPTSRSSASISTSGSWIDIARGWLRGADALYAHLAVDRAWQQGKVWRYEKYIEEPRLGAGFTIANRTASRPRRRADARSSSATARGSTASGCSTTATIATA